MRRHEGFTLLELLIVVAIVGVIAAISYPSYVEYAERTRRSDAQGALMELAAAMERHYASSNTYEGAADGGGDTGSPGIFPDETPLEGNDKFYDLTITAATDSTYTLRATPKSIQAGNGILELDSTGARRWDESADGGFDAGENDWQD
ncbi:type IV pilus assembly protein PilE [Marinobacter sp. es.048]|uniref:type IV pilin protein n=1 Tax=Marinobacter sp. es.048 TaxID=1761795 RepID=UPI000B589406|nr:type IV pilin protein [Marinobacter sp. es.048]SNC76528.1 type IV pilus assembly protein PilE [Marinobacter sp. es.048]